MVNAIYLINSCRTMGKCRFNSKWLCEKDDNGRVISEWARKLDDDNLMCCVCDKKISLQRGRQAILQHSRGEKHRKSYRLKVQENQHLGLIDNERNQEETYKDTSQPMFHLHTFKDGVIKAELIWTMRMLMHNQTFRSCQGLNEAFAVMFPCDISAGFSLSETKCRYLVTEALGPFFREKLINDCQGKFVY